MVLARRHSKFGIVGSAQILRWTVLNTSNDLKYVALERGNDPKTQLMETYNGLNPWRYNNARTFSSASWPQKARVQVQSQAGRVKHFHSMRGLTMVVVLVLFCHHVFAQVQVRQGGVKQIALSKDFAKPLGSDEFQWLGYFFTLRDRINVIGLIGGGTGGMNLALFSAQIKNDQTIVIGDVVKEVSLTNDSRLQTKMLDSPIDLAEYTGYFLGQAFSNRKVDGGFHYLVDTIDVEPLKSNHCIADFLPHTGEKSWWVWSWDDPHDIVGKEAVQSTHKPDVGLVYNSSLSRFCYTARPTVTPTLSPTASWTPSVSSTPSSSTTRTPSATASLSCSRTMTRTPSSTATSSATGSPPPSVTPSRDPSTEPATGDGVGVDAAVVWVGSIFGVLVVVIFAILIGCYMKSKWTAKVSGLSDPDRSRIKYYQE